MKSLSILAGRTVVFSIYRCFHCLCFLCLFGSCFVIVHSVLPSYVIKRVGCFTLIVFCLCSVSLPRGAVGWSVVCDCVPFPGNTHLR